MFEHNVVKNIFGLVYRIIFCETHYLVVFIQMISNFVLANIYIYIYACFNFLEIFFEWEIFKFNQKVHM
jgi:hypothetical protein